MFIFVAIFVCARLVPTIMMQLELAPATEAYMASLQKTFASNAPNNNQAGPQFFGTMARVMLIFQLITVSVLVLLQLGFCLFGYSYLGRDYIERLFERAS